MAKLAVTGTATLDGWYMVDALRYRCQVTPSEAGMLAISLPAGAAQDAWGNGNSAAPSLTVMVAPPQTGGGMSGGGGGGGCGAGAVLAVLTALGLRRRRS